MTSVIDNSSKVSEYIVACRQMHIAINPPDINEGEAGFSVRDGAIVYALTALKSVGRPVIGQIIQEREQGGKFLDLKDFITRTLSRDVNKRTIESFIKAGALDCLPGNRRQKMMVYQKLMDECAREKKTSMTGQMSLFDFMGEEDKKAWSVQFPDIPEFPKETKLGFEKEVLGIYASGHPLEAYEDLWRKQISAVSGDFMLDEESGRSRLGDNQKVIVGGMLEDKTVKYTRNNQAMAFATLEDLVGTLEVIVFPKDYEKYGPMLEKDAKLFVQGRVSAEEDKASKLICEKMWRFEDVHAQIWIQFPTKEDYMQRAEEIRRIVSAEPGDDEIIIYVRDPRSIAKLGRACPVKATKEVIGALKDAFGEENVKVR